MEGNPTMADEDEVYEIRMIRAMTRAAIDARDWDEAVPLMAATLHAGCVHIIAHSNMSETNRLQLYTETLKNVNYAVNYTTRPTGDVLARLSDELSCVYNGTRKVPDGMGAQ
jgi:hypothetical protein